MLEPQIVTRSQTKVQDSATMSQQGGASPKGLSDTHSPGFPVHKWNLVYDGSTCVRSFIERVEELADSRGVSKSDLFSSAIELFTGDALNWFRVNRSIFNSWCEIVAGLKDEFELLDQDKRLVAQLRATCQTPKENLGSFITKVLLINNRLSKKLPEDEILDILQCNMLPRYIHKLSLTEISNIASLKKYGKMIELADSRSDARNHPGFQTNHHQTSSNSSNTKANNNSANNNSFNNMYKIRENFQNNRNIPNFRKNQNFFNNSNRSPNNVNFREPVRCFRCGRHGVKAPDCTCKNRKN